MLTKLTRNTDPVRSALLISYNYQKKVSKRFPINPFKVAYNISKFEHDPIAKNKIYRIREF